MHSKLRKTDERCADIVTAFLEKHFYTTKTTDYHHVTNKEEQVKGIDSIFTLNGFNYHCDEKAAIRYVNKHLYTFSLELSFINRANQIQTGWLLDTNKINDSFLFVWIDKAKRDILESVNDIQELEFALVKRTAIVDYLESIGWNIKRLEVKQDYIRNNTDESMGNLYRNKCKFSYSPGLVEKPINILLSRDTYLSIADFHEKICC